MKNTLHILQQSVLFRGMAEQDITSMLSCLSAQNKSYQKDEYLLRAGEVTSSVRLVLSGNVDIMNDDFWGNRNIISRITAGQIFAESYAATPDAVLQISAVCETDVTLLSIDMQSILTTCPSHCKFHTTLIHNLLACLSEKNLYLNEKITHISQRSTKNKLLSYLSSQSQRYHSPEFDIPFNRQQLADYLSVERSALSAELSKLHKEGILSFHKNHFVLLKSQ